MLSKRIVGKEIKKVRSKNSRHHGDILPRHKMDEDARLPRAAYEMIHDEMFFEANPRLNMATFVTTYMEPEAEKLMIETFDKNFIDKPIYPQTLEMQQRCISIIADLFTGDHDAAGVATVGSSEAIHLAGLTMKWNWRTWYNSKYKQDPSTKPNIIMGSNVQVCWKKFCTYFEVDLIEIPLGSDFNMDIAKAIAAINDNTIGVVGILGNTYTGSFDDIERLNELLLLNNNKFERNVPIHVDGASGGFVAPFTDIHKDVVWDFNLELVQSINVSGHKYGMVYPGIGWAIWKSEKLIPKELIFHVAYLGEEQEDFGLNFSRGASQIVAQYYNFVRYGMMGYRQIMNSLMDLASELKDGLSSMSLKSGSSLFKIISDDSGLPLVAIVLSDEAEEFGLTLEKLSHKAKEKGWVLPVYPLSEPYEKMTIMRIVLREGFNSDMIEKMISDIDWAAGAVLENIIEMNGHGSHGVC